MIRVRKFAFPNLHQNIFEHVRKLGYLGESKKTATPLNRVNGPKEFIHHILGKSIFQFRQTILQFFQLFPHFHEEILKDFVFRIH